MFRNKNIAGFVFPLLTAVSVSSLVAVSQTSGKVSVNPGVKATVEQAEAAFKAHDKVHESFSTLDSGKRLAEDWSDLRHELLKGGEENQKLRELIGRILIIADTDKGIKLKRYTDGFVTIYGAELDPKKSAKILANFHRLAIENAKVESGAAFAFIGTGMVERKYGKLDSKELNAIIDLLVDRCKGADWPADKR